MLPTDLVLTLHLAKVRASELPWSRSVFDDAVSIAFTISASYPKVTILAVSRSFARRSFGHSV